MHHFYYDILAVSSPFGSKKSMEMQLFIASLLVAFISAQNLEPQPHLLPRGEETTHCRLCDPDNALCEYRGVNSRGVKEFECMCKTGYTGNGITCTEVDPCSADLDNCDVNADCKWLGGTGYSCDCKAGFNGDGRTCQDVNECATTNRCDPTNSRCVNTIGTFECVCLSGFVHATLADGTEDKTTCIDRDECSLPTFQCPINSVCTNNVGSYSCDCNPGFVKSADGLFCNDLDECTQYTPHPCDKTSSTCQNLPAGFECQCLPGFQHPATGDNINCYDINECSVIGFSGCPTNSACVNTRGSYQCQCADGYEMSIDGSACVDTNECAATLNPCDLNRSTCINLMGGYECTCNTGYSHATTNRKICADINECTEGTSACSTFATCDNEIGGYKCTCFYGYVGDGKQCTEASPSLAQLDASIANLTSTQIYLKLHTAYYENLHQKTELERYRRLCPLKKAGLLPAGIRVKRDLASDLKDLTSGSIAEQKFKLQSLLHANSEVSLQIAILKRECGFN